MATKEMTPEQAVELEELLQKAHAAQKILETYDQERIDHLCKAVAWAISNLSTFRRLTDMGVEESRLGDPVSRLNKRNKIRLILHECMKQPSVGIIEEIPEKGITKYAKPVGVIASLVPTTNPVLTPGGQAVYGIKARDAIIFSPHPRAKKTTYEAVRIMREALEKEGAPADILQCIPTPATAQTQALMSRADLTIATGGRPMVQAAYSSGRPAYGSGAGNATMIYDETADVVEACHNTMLSKTSDYGSGCSADGNLVVHESIYDAVIEQLQVEGGYFAQGTEKDSLRAVMWDEEAHRLPDTVAISPQKLANAAGFDIPEDRKFIFVEGDGIGKGYDKAFCSEKLTTLLAIHKYCGEFQNAINMSLDILEVGGKGHSVGIYSFDDDHINRLAMVAPVSRMMVRQPQSKSNSGSTTNGMPPTSSMSCGTWGGNIGTENITLKHYMNITWLSRPIPEEKFSVEELFGDFYDGSLEV